MEFGAYESNPMYGGNLIGRGVLICDPVHEPLSVMPDEDYEREGFAWLAAHIQVLPAAAYSQGWAPCTRAKFEEWRATSDVLYTVRFRISEIT